MKGSYGSATKMKLRYLLNIWDNDILESPWNNSLCLSYSQIWPNKMKATVKYGLRIYCVTSMKPFENQRAAYCSCYTQWILTYLSGRMVLLRVTSFSNSEWKSSLRSPCVSNNGLYLHCLYIRQNVQKS